MPARSVPIVTILSARVSFTVDLVSLCFKIAAAFLSLASILFIPVQPVKAPRSIVVLLNTFTKVNSSQYAKADLAILETPLGITRLPETTQSPIIKVL